MQFFANIAAAAVLAASLVSATNTVTFLNQDETNRTIVFTASYGQPAVENVKVAGNDQIKVEIPNGWQGNWYSIDAGAPATPGMLGEVAFNGWNDLTYFDVSAIVNNTDLNGVKTIYPASQLNTTSKVAMSGCENMAGCTNMYILSDDIQTVSTKETDLVCTLGGGNKLSTTVTQRDEPVLFARKFVLGKL